MSSTDESGREVLEIDENGPAELLPRSFAHDARCTVGRPRNLLICRLFGFRDGPLVGLNASARDFTRFDCLSDEPSIRRTKLPRGGRSGQSRATDSAAGVSPQRYAAHQSSEPQPSTRHGLTRTSRALYGSSPRKRKIRAKSRNHSRLIPRS